MGQFSTVKGELGSSEALHHRAGGVEGPNMVFSGFKDGDDSLNQILSLPCSVLLLLFSLSGEDFLVS